MYCNAQLQQLLRVVILRKIKVLIALQQHYETSEFVNCYSEAETHIIEIPANQSNLVCNLSRIFNAAQNIFRDVLTLYSYTEGLEKQVFTKLQHYWTKLSDNLMYGSDEVLLLKSVGWNKIEQVVAETLRSQDKSLVNLVCHLYDWRVVQKLPCVVDNVLPIIIEN